MSATSPAELHINGILAGLEMAATICEAHARGRKSLQAERIRKEYQTMKLTMERENVGE